MTAVRNRNVSFKLTATVGMVLLMAFFSACDVLATEGARDAIAGSREIREFEDQTLRPIENEMNDLWVNEIEPREREVEDLRHELQRLQEELLTPLWDSQNDPWAPGGEAALAQEVFDELNREHELMQRAIDLEQRELDANWQILWSGNTVDPAYQELEDLRFEKQRELDRLYRFGNRPIDDIWDQINELNSSQGFANTDSQIESELINAELRRLWDLQSELQNGANSATDDLYKRAEAAQNDLNDLHSFGWREIEDIYAEIENLGLDGVVTTTAGVTEEVATKIIDLQSLVASYEAQRDTETAPLKAQLDALDSGQTFDAAGNLIGGTVLPVEEILELKAKIESLELEAAALVDAKEIEIGEFEDEIDAKHASFNELIDSLEADFLTQSENLLLEAVEVQNQIDDLQELGGDDAIAEIAVLQPRYDALIASEQAAEDELHETVDALLVDHNAEIADLEEKRQALIDLIADGLTNDIEAQIAEYQAGLEALELGDDSTTSDESDTTDTRSDLLAAIDEIDSKWGVLIAEVNNQILILQSQTTTETSVGGGSNDARIANLKLQAAELEAELLKKIANLEAVVNELYNQANSGNGQSAELEAVNRQIEEMNSKLEEIWQQNSADGLEILIQVQALEKQVRVLENEREDEQYRLEEELWDLDDQLSRFYKDQNSDQQLKEVEYQTIADGLQQRRFELDELRWQTGIDQQDMWDELNTVQAETTDKIRQIEDEQLGALKLQIRELEDALQVYYDQQRDLENDLRTAQGLVEEKKRELEDKVFDALESAAGTVDEAGETLLTATEEVGDIPEITETPISEEIRNAAGELIN